MITYIGNSAFNLISVVPQDRSDGMRQVTETWRGPDADLEAFLAARVLGTSRADGAYLVDKSGNGGGGAYVTADLVYMLPPDFVRFEQQPSTSLQTVSISATVDTGSGQVPGSTAMDGTRTINYLARQKTFTYYAASEPLSARFTSTGYPLTTPITVFSDSVQINFQTPTGTVTRKSSFSWTPGALASELQLPLQNRVQLFSATPIEYTPWFRCEDTVAFGFFAD